MRIVRHVYGVVNHTPFALHFTSQGDTPGIWSLPAHQRTVFDAVPVTVPVAGEVPDLEHPACELTYVASEPGAAPTSGFVFRLFAAADGFGNGVAGGFIRYANHVVNKPLWPLRCRALEPFPNTPPVAEKIYIAVSGDDADGADLRVNVLPCPGGATDIPAARSSVARDGRSARRVVRCANQTDWTLRLNGTLVGHDAHFDIDIPAISDAAQFTPSHALTLAAFATADGAGSPVWTFLIARAGPGQGLVYGDFARARPSFRNTRIIEPWPVKPDLMSDRNVLKVTAGNVEHGPWDLHISCLEAKSPANGDGGNGGGGGGGCGGDGPG